MGSNPTLPAQRIVFAVVIRRAEFHNSRWYIQKRAHHGSSKKGQLIYIYMQYMIIYAYIYIYTWKAIKTKFSVHTGLNIFFVRYGLFSKYGHVRLQTLYLQVNSFRESRSGSDSMSVSSGDSIWGSMLTFVYCFFPT